MAMPRRFRVGSGDAFAHGLYVFPGTEVEPARDFDKSTRDKFVQEIDKDSELPIWTLEVMDADPDAPKAARALTVRIVSTEKPVLPEMPAGWPVRPVDFEGLMAIPYVDSTRCTGERSRGEHRCRARLAWAFRATGVVPPKPTSAARGPASRAAKEDAA
jgi:hypothetical protein